MICTYCKQEIDINAGEHNCEERKQALWGFKSAKGKRKGQTEANYLTQQIIDYVIQQGGAARRVNVTGRYIEGQAVKVPIGTSGKYRTLYTKGKWIKSGMLPGFEDISAVKPKQAMSIDRELTNIDFGQYVAIEVKVGNDRLSQDQILRKDEVERAGGVYLVARNFEGFIKDWNEI